MTVDHRRLARIQDERMVVCIDEGIIYKIEDLQIVENEIWIITRSGVVFKDTDVLTLDEAGNYYDLKQTFNLE
jgi:hypothetical protein